MLDFATSFTVTSKYRFSSPFGHRFVNYILQVLQIVGPYAVLIVVQDDWVYSLVFAFLVLLQRNPVVDSLVLEYFFYST